MNGVVNKLIPNPAKNVLKKIYAVVFKSKVKIKEQNEKIKALEYQVEYLKHHFDITQMKPATGYLREFQLR